METGLGIERWRIADRIGEEYGWVRYAARDAVTGGRAVVSVADEHAARRWRSDPVARSTVHQLAGRLLIPNARPVLAVHDGGGSAGPRIVEPWIDGVSPIDLAEELELPELLVLIADVARVAAAYEHANLVHGAIRASTVLVDAAGIAHVGVGGVALGTAGIDPLRARTWSGDRFDEREDDPRPPGRSETDRPDAAWDRFQLGYLAWTLLAGSGPTGEPLREVVPWLAPELADLVDQLTSRVPSSRPEAIEFVRAIDLMLALGGPGQARAALGGAVARLLAARASAA
jgi:hypothetical protein